MSRTELEISGKFFEFQLQDELKKQFPGCIILHDIEIYCPSLQKDTQLDLILFTNKVSIVIEAKNWTEWLKGNCNDTKWTGKSRGRNVLTVFNPVNQNKLHIRALRNAIRCYGVEPPFMHNLVCVPDGTNVISDCKEVCSYSGLMNRIQDLEYKSNLSIDKIALANICNKVASKG